MNSQSIDMSVRPSVQGFIDTNTNTISYLVSDPNTNVCAIVDPVLDIDIASGRVSYDSADKLIRAAEEKGYENQWIIETHVHADHITAAPYVKKHIGGKIGIGSEIRTVQSTFAKVFNEASDFPVDGSQFDVRFHDNERYQVGSISAFCISTPGHTPACMTHVIGDAAFVGDTLFMPDAGTARADFPGGNAGTLYESIHKILALADETRLFMCHDYGPGGRELNWETTVAEQRRDNIHVGGTISKSEFIQLRESRDKTLSVPKLILPSLQVNIRAGEFPLDARGAPVLRIPINAL